MEFTERCRQEVRDLHEFFAAWYHGEVPVDGFDRVEDALAPEFVLVGPDGTRRERATLLADIRAGHGERTPLDAGQDGGDEFDMSVTALSVADSGGDRCLVTYEEHHHGAVESARASAAWFRPASTPMGVEWLFVQETWLPDGAPPDAD